MGAGGGRGAKPGLTVTFSGGVTVRSTRITVSEITNATSAMAAPTRNAVV